MLLFVTSVSLLLRREIFIEPSRKSDKKQYILKTCFLLVMVDSYNISLEEKHKGIK